MSDFFERISKLSPSRLALLALELQTKLENAERARNAPIAIIGMGCRFPGAESPDAFWTLLRDGVDAIREIPETRWDPDAYYDPDADAPGKVATRWGGFVEPIDTFEPQIFGISPREAMSMDPQQRLLLEVTWEALERAGQSPQRLNGSATGVFVGICNSDYGQVLLDGDTDQIDAYLSTGNAHSVASGRLSYVLGLQGPSLSVDTACSSSLVAMHLAIQSLRSGECRMALAGGVNAILSPLTTITLSRARMMASDGRCKAFDARADGFVRSEGCGMLVLKRLSDAQADGDTVLAVLRGSALNQDGRSNGLTAPNGPSQIAVIRAALADAGLTPADVQYVETHGTGTSLGDPIEAQALGAAYSDGRPPADRLRIGSVKTNLGHLESAAGVAGLIKLVLMLQHGEIPPHLHLTQLSPHIAWDELPLDIPTVRTPWPERAGRRIAGVSSFGFSGTNAHLIIESPPAPAPPPEDTGRAQHLLTLSARTPTALRTLAGAYARHLERSPELHPADVASTANRGRAALAYRMALVGESTAELRTGLAAFAAGDTLDAIITGHAEGPRAPAVAFLFTGHGAHYAGMGRALYASEPLFRQMIDRCEALLRDQIDLPLTRILFAEPGDATHNGTGSPLDHMEYAQPALFALQMALATLWRSWGIAPAAVAGHSAGEYAAAVIAGVMSLEDGLRLVTTRGRLMASLPPDGEMAAVFAGEEQVGRILTAHTGRVSIAAINGPESLTISGSADAVRAALADCEVAGIKTRALAIPVAAHSPQIEPILQPFSQVAATIRYAAPQIEVVSGMTGALVGERELTDPDYWRQHLRRPVRFADAAQTLYRQGYRVFVEIGPHPTLLGMMRRFLPQEGAVWAASLRQHHEELRQMLTSLGALATAGVPIDWEGVYRHEQRRKVELPTYPFERSRYWIDPAPQRAPRERRAAEAHPLLGQPLRSPALQATVFETRVGAAWPPYLAHHRIQGVALMPSPVYVEMALEAGRTLGPDHSTIEQFEIKEALILPEDGERCVQCVLTPQEAGAASFEIHSQADDGDGWILHATGRLAQTTTAATSIPLRIEEIQARCTEQIEAADYYARLHTMGLEFGESFRGLRRIWRRDGEALGRVELPHGLEADRYTIHPALLDACFHLLGAPLRAEGENAYLLIAIDRFRVYSAPGTHLWNHTRLRPGFESEGEIFVGDILLYNDTGTLVAEASGLHLKAASRSALLQATRRHRSDWLYDIRWLPKPLAQSEAGPSYDAESLQAMAARVLPHVAQLAEQYDLAHVHHLIPELEALSTAYVLRALHRLGWSPLPGRRVSAEALADELAIAPPHRRLFARMLAMLAEEGLLRAVGDGWEVVSPLYDPGDQAARVAALQARFPDDAAVVLTIRCGEALADLLQGNRNPLALLFPNGSLDLTEALYRDSASAKVHNGAMRAVVDLARAARPGGRSLRVLEIGAGSGATTASLLPALPAESIEYWFTDLSPLFLTRAKHTFDAYPFVRYALFDAERDPQEQGIPVGGFDIVVAANVLHATADLRQTLANVQRTLAPGGLLILLEGTRPLRWVDLTFGLTEGWWRFTDHDLRPAHPLLRAGQWIDLLNGCGFTEATPLSGDPEHADQVILLARAEPIHAQRTDAHWLILADCGGVGDAVAARLMHSGAAVTLARPDTDPATGDAGHRRIVPHAPEEFRRLIAGLAPSASPLHVLYLWGLDAPSGEESKAEAILNAQDLSCTGVLSLTKALVGQSARLWIATRNAQPARSDDAPVAVAQAPLWGLGRVLALEHPELWGGLIDLSAEADPQAESGQILTEIRALDGEDQVAWRGGVRYAPRLVRAPQRAGHALALDAEASYLVTGGLGGLGLKVARWLVERGARHLILTGRRGLPERSAWARLSAGSREADQVAALQEMEAQGATVHALQADVADRAQMTALLARLGADLPPLRGIIHAAADLSSAPMRELPLEAVRAQLRPKLGGGWLLHELTRRTPLDFFVLFSSTTALWGSRGLAHYAAANQALDALAHHRHALGLPALSINWGTWDEMRAASAAEQQQVVSYGLLQMPAPQALEILGNLIGEGSAVQKAVASVDWRVLKTAYEARGARPFLHLVEAGTRIAPTPEAATADATPALLRAWADAASADRPAIVTAFVRHAVARALGVGEGHPIDDRQGLFEMGMDSLMSIELKGRLEAAVGRPLPSTLTFNYPSVEALAGYLTHDVLAEEETEQPPPSAPAAVQTESESDARAPDELSEDELAARIAAKLARLH